MKSCTKWSFKLKLGGGCGGELMLCNWWPSMPDLRAVLIISQLRATICIDFEVTHFSTPAQESSHCAYRVNSKKCAKLWKRSVNRQWCLCVSVCLRGVWIVPVFKLWCHQGAWCSALSHVAWSHMHSCLCEACKMDSSLGPPASDASVLHFSTVWIKKL